MNRIFDMLRLFNRSGNKTNNANRTSTRREKKKKKTREEKKNTQNHPKGKPNRWKESTHKIQQQSIRKKTSQSLRKTEIQMLRVYLCVVQSALTHSYSITNIYLSTEWSKKMKEEETQNRYMAAYRYKVCLNVSQWCVCVSFLCHSCGNVSSSKFFQKAFP